MFICPVEYRELLLLLTCESPVSATVHPSDLHLVEAIVQSRHVTHQALKELQENIPVLYRNLAGLDVLTPALLEILQKIIDKVMLTFSEKECRPQDTPGVDPLS